jgi:hypothetical protein
MRVGYRLLEDVDEFVTISSASMPALTAAN